MPTQSSRTPIDDWEAEVEDDDDGDEDADDTTAFVAGRTKVGGLASSEQMKKPARSRKEYIERYTLGSTVGGGGEDVGRMLGSTSSSPFGMTGLNAALAHAAYAAESQPSVKIMRRQDQDALGARRRGPNGQEMMDPAGAGGQQSLEARERAYREARERIFGPTLSEAVDAGTNTRTQTSKKSGKGSGNALAVESLSSQVSSRSGSDSEPRLDPTNESSRPIQSKRAEKKSQEARVSVPAPTTIKKKSKAKGFQESTAGAVDLAGQGPVDSSGGSPLLNVPDELPASGRESTSFSKDPRTVKAFVPRSSPVPSRTASPSIRARAEKLGTAIRPPRGPGQGRGFESRQERQDGAGDVVI